MHGLGQSLIYVMKSALLRHAAVAAAVSRFSRV